MCNNMYIKYNIVSPSNLSVEVLTPGSSKCGLNLLMCRYHWLMLVIWELSGAPDFNLTGVLIKKEIWTGIYVYRENIR